MDARLSRLCHKWYMRVRDVKLLHACGRKLVPPFALHNKYLCVCVVCVLFVCVCVCVDVCVYVYE